MHEHKLPEFNPLDLLATAASLQRPGRGITSSAPSSSPGNSETDPPVMRRDTGQCRLRSAAGVSVDSGKQKTKRLESDLKLYKVVVKNELSKMLEEHNYGHPKRNFRYILHDEPFSSVDNETELKLMDSNYNECRDCLESLPQGEATTGSDVSEPLCDNNGNGIAEKASRLNDSESAVYKMDTSDCSENSISTDTSVLGVNVSSPAVNSDKSIPGCSTLELLEPSSTCSGSLLPVKGTEGVRKTDGPVEHLPEVRSVDRLESCEEEQTLVDVETVQTDTNGVEEAAYDQQAEQEQYDSSTLDGFIVSDLCHSCEASDPADNKPSGESVDKDTVVSATSGLTSGGGVVSTFSGDPCPAPGLLPGQVQLSPPPEMAVTGNVKKQTIIRSLLTGETIVVVQKSQNGSKDVGKIPLMVDPAHAGKLHVAGNIAGNSGEKWKAASSTEALEEVLLHRDSRNVTVDKSDTVKSEPVPGSNNKVKELTDIEIARQQNRINSEKLKLSGKEVNETEQVSSSGIKQLNSTSQLHLPIATAVPLSDNQPVKKAAMVMKPTSVHNALLSKLSNGISQRKARGSSVLLPSARLEQFNIGRFASMSSRKIGLVVQAIPKLQICGIKNAAEKAGNVPDYENAAYQQVIKQFPNLVKAYKDDDLLKMAVAPDDVLECLPTTVSRTPIEDHVFHDHDYCVRGVPMKGSASRLPGDGCLMDDIDREPKLGRPPKNGDRRKKATKRALESLASRATPPGEDSSRADVVSSSETKPNSEVKLEVELKSAPGKRRSSRQKSGRDSSPGENPDSPDMDVNGDGAKVKITGAFQDDFVYFINKTSRNRRRASEQPQVPVVPMPQASDIYIPHLSDADIAALKDRPVANPPLAGHTSITDEDSKVINTILSMETSLERTEAAAEGFGFPAGTGDALSGLDLTQEQMDILYSAIEQVNSDPSVEKFQQENFGIEPEVVLSPVSSDTGDAEKPVVKEPPQATETAVTFSDTHTPLLDNEDNLHMPNMDLILSNTTSLKNNLPTLDASEVQDSISAITSTSSSPTPLDSSLAAIPATIPASVNSTVLNPQTNPYSVTVASTEDQKLVPQSGISDLSLGSFDKSLDLLGVGDMKTDLFPEVGVSQENTASSEANSPWIVTVSMYWNDLPAIMLGNQPYVRLVDIYKQILPAKDTGILKKRCQLLGMEVKNCSEMQRYFLVKYGRGYNSKSTLVVSKDDAKRLIGFYVEPQSRTTKADGTVEKMPSSPLPVSKFRKAITETASDSTTSSSVPSCQSAKKDRPKCASPRTPSKRRVVVAPVGESVSKRLRHKKINFRSMLQGIKRDDEVVESESPQSPTRLSDDPAAQSEVRPACPGDVECESEGVSRRQSRTHSDSNQQPCPSSTTTTTHSQPGPLNSDKLVPVKPRSYNSRATLKSSRPHSFGLPSSLRPYNLLGRQLRRVKASFPNNGSLQNVLKKRQLNGAVQQALIKPDEFKTGIPNLQGVKQQTLDPRAAALGVGPHVEGNVNAPAVGPRRVSSRSRRSVTAAAVSNRVRSSGRKRKLKQLYPIENYSYAKKVKKEADNTVCVQRPQLETSRHPRVRPTLPVRTSPRKKRADVISGSEVDRYITTNSRATSEDEENRPKNVITLTNGPEYETFTALSGDMNV